jgi:hypothetical protein
MASMVFAYFCCRVKRMVIGGTRATGFAFSYNKNEEQQIIDLLLTFSIIETRLDFVNNLKGTQY